MVLREVEVTKVRNTGLSSHCDVKRDALWEVVRCPLGRDLLFDVSHNRRHVAVVKVPAPSPQCSESGPIPHPPRQVIAASSTLLHTKSTLNTKRGECAIMLHVELGVAVNVHGAQERQRDVRIVGAHPIPTKTPKAPPAAVRKMIMGRSL